MRQYIILLNLCCVIFLNASAQTHRHDSLWNHWSVRGSYALGKEIPLDQYERLWLKDRNSMVFHLMVGHNALPSDSDDYAADYGYPTLSGGIAFQLSDVTMRRTANENWGLSEMADYDSRLGNAVSLFGTFTRPISRTRFWMVDYELGTGISYHHKKYNPNNNVDDELIGSRWCILFIAGLHLTRRLSHDWSVRAGVEFYHYSNGALNRPNKGSNTVAPMVGVVWMPGYEDCWKQQQRHQFHSRRLPHSLFLYLTVGISGRTFDQAWQITQFKTSPRAPYYHTSRFHVNPVYTTSASLLYRYARRWASGIGIDWDYIDTSGQPEYTDEPVFSKYGRHSLGLSANHEVFYHRLSIAMQLGFYLYRDKTIRTTENEKIYYERIGIYYHFPILGGLRTGFCVKAHKTKAEYAGIQLSIPFTIWKEQEGSEK